MPENVNFDVTFAARDGYFELNFKVKAEDMNDFADVAFRPGFEDLLYRELKAGLADKGLDVSDL